MLKNSSEVGSLWNTEFAQIKITLNQKLFDSELIQISTVSNHNFIESQFHQIKFC